MPTVFLAVAQQPALPIDRWPPHQPALRSGTRHRWCDDGRLVASRIQPVDGITRTLTCTVIHR
jgi:hypothetical protein